MYYFSGTGDGAVKWPWPAARNCHVRIGPVSLDPQVRRFDHITPFDDFRIDLLGEL
jgi:hypothetical protein